MTLKRIGPLSVAKIGGLVYACLGLLVGLLVSMFSMIGAGLGLANDESGAIVGLFFGIGAAVALPIFYGLIGFVLGALMAWLYNVFAGIVGGIEVDLG